MPHLLSILIPTHNRAKYAFFSIRSLLSLQTDKIEIIVSDTSDNSELYNLLAKSHSLISDTRLRYLRPTIKLDMTGNHNFVMSQAQGKYVCLIGDDDTVSDEIVLATEWANENDIDIISPNVVSNYVWPDFRSITFGAKHASRLYLPKKIGKIVHNDSVFAFKNAMQNAAQGTDGLPKIYHGIVKKELFDTLYEKAGNYFWGSSPDVSGAIALAQYSKNFISVDYPLTIPGASGGSNTGRSAMNKHKGKLSEESQTKSFIDKGWSEGVPKFFSVETVWAHAALETISKLNNILADSFNYAKLIAVCEILHPEYKEEIKLAAEKARIITGITEEQFNRNVGKEKLKYKAKRITYILRRALHPTAAGGRRFIENLDTVESAMTELSKYIKRHGWSWTKTLN